MPGGSPVNFTDFLSLNSGRVEGVAVLRGGGIELWWLDEGRGEGVEVRMLWCDLGRR